MDYTADPYIGADGCSDNATYWQNGAHPNATGYGILANYVRTAVDGVLTA